MEVTNINFPSNDNHMNNMHQVPTQQAIRPREKSKRPQLSCNPCRARKVKCDRIQPCTACSLHQIAELCQFDLSEAERQPILQAEALKDRDKTIAQLRNEVAILRGEPIKLEPMDDAPFQSGQKIKLPPRVPRKPTNLAQKRTYTGEINDNIYFGSPAMTSVVEEFAHLAFDRNSANLTHTLPRGTDIFAFQLATSHPFPTLWSAKDDTSTLIKLLPPEPDLFFYLDVFQRRAQTCSFPHVPDECTSNEVRRFLENVELNAALHPDMLALLFTTLAQGSQDGVYDKYGGKWVAGSVEAESKNGDVYIAAAMQCLRLASFMNRPTLLVIEALVMMGPYLTNSGKFLDASALFGGTVRLAQSIGLHRDPRLLNPPAPLKEVKIRKNLWWWMLHMDQQYSITLSRPLAISSMGDCPAADPIVSDPVTQSLSNYIAQFSILGRQILSTAYLNNEQIDRFSDDLLALQKTLPTMIQFDATWLEKDKPLPPWPLDAQAGVLHAKTHNFLILLNRQRIENVRRNSDPPSIDIRTFPSNNDPNGVPRGRDRVLASSRALLVAFEYFHIRVRPALICWTMGQMGFNAAMILLLSMLETGDTQDLAAVQHTYSTFLEMNKLGIHKFAGAAVERLGIIMKEFRTGDPENETVMGSQGMMLLEDPGLQGSLPETYSPLSFEMAGGANTPGMQRSSTESGRGAQLARKKAARRPMSGRDMKGRSIKKVMSGAHRPVTDRRFSDGAPPRPHKKQRANNRSTPNLSLLTALPGQHQFSVTPQPTVKPETLFSPIESTFQAFHPINSPAPSPPDRNRDFETTPRPQFPQPHEHILGLTQQQHHHAASDPGHDTFNFSNATTPGAATEVFAESFQKTRQPFAGVDRSAQNLTSYDHPPYSAPPFSLPDEPSSAYHRHF
ncbi:hypothetical protein ABVK25_008269 [Lepraria finkii]|uniref:Zn(2)-C6 fungal-type domain-containing protein n=1 Tax=Lepraria finkii TaxID=1340010 RepID=A0ABR4B0H2_9LECA